MSAPAMTPQQARLSGRGSAWRIYRELATGGGSLPHFLLYELLTTTLSGLPGLAGFGLRSLLYPPLFSRCGRRPAIGRGVVVRNPRRISLGNRVMVDDYAVLDVRGDEGSLELADHVAVGRFTTLAAKGGAIALGSGVNIGSHCRIATQSRVSIGASTLVAAYCYIGPGNHQSGDGETPLIAREMEIRGGVEIGEHVWIGAHTTILDGVTIGSGAIIGAHTLVREDVPAGAVVVGVPGRVVRRGAGGEQVTA